MKRLLVTVYLVIFLSLANASFEYRDLSDAEDAALRAAASKSAGIDVWLMQGNVIRADAGDTSQVNVIFEPADVSGYCLAPSAYFTAENANGELLEWRPSERGTVQYRFWYQACDEADPQSPIVLEQYVDVSVLERLSRQLDQIVGDAVRSSPPEREYNVPISEHELRRIGIRFDSEHGAVYKLNYRGTVCRGLSIDAVLRRDEINVLRSAEWIC